MADQWNLTSFLDEVGSGNVAPAGGTVVGFVGAAGTSLVEMALIHTLENTRGSSDRTDLLETAIETLRHQRSTLVSLAEADADTVNSLYGETESASDPVEKRATGIPFTMATACSNVLSAAFPIAEHTAENVAADMFIGLSFVVTAALNAIRIVQTNLEGAEDRDQNEYAKRADALHQTIAADVERLEVSLGMEFSQTVPES